MENLQRIQKTYRARTVHNLLALPLASLWIYMGATGCLWTILRIWLGLDKASTSWLMKLHHLNFFGLKYIFTPTLGPLTLVFLFTGFQISSFATRRQKPRWGKSFRMMHGFFSYLAVFPFLYLSITGAAYEICRSILGMEKSSVHFFLELHNMSIAKLESVFPLVCFSIILGMAFTGITMSKQWISLKKRFEYSLNNFDVEPEEGQGSPNYIPLHTVETGESGDEEVDNTTVNELADEENLDIPGSSTTKSGNGNLICESETAPTL